ncbi:MAG TPA: tetratricopeptide repeat protein, partial [Kofleriaceae bacterium]|nr:tetratricopeptide repeat protein [Kofleriaceae bacterium]
AAHIYDRVAVMSELHRQRALAGKATLLVDLGKLESALALFEILRAEQPDDLDVAEGRARALAELGRTDEATAEYRRFVALATSRSDLRVRAALLWINAHG